jgi:hypothetical protein
LGAKINQFIGNICVAVRRKVNSRTSGNYSVKNYFQNSTSMFVNKY